MSSESFGVTLGLTYRMSNAECPSPLGFTAGIPIMQLYQNLGGTVPYFFRINFEPISITYGPGDTLATSTYNIVVQYFNNGSVVTSRLGEVDGGDPQLGGTLPTPGVARSLWPFVNLQAKYQFSTFDTVGGTYASDGTLEVQINGSTVFSVSGLKTNIWSSVSANYFFTHGKFVGITAWACGDVDALYLCNTAVYPTFSGSQHVPSGANLLYYEDFNAGTAPGWDMGSFNSEFPLGPWFNATAGLAGTGSISLGPNAPSSNQFGGERGYGTITRLGSLDAPPVGTGTIVVNKLVFPDDDTTSFAFAINGGLSPSTFNLANGESQIFLSVPAGTYNVSETTPSHWTTSWLTSNGSPHGALTVANGEVVTITATNTKLGKITVKKQINPFNDSGDTFSFTASGGLSPSTFSLGHDDEQVFNDLTPGTYGISEDADGDYTTVIVVSNGDDPSAIDVAAGDDITVMAINIPHSVIPTTQSPGGIFEIVPSSSRSFGKSTDDVISELGENSEEDIPTPYIYTGLIRDL